jgi:hypothetical protein
MKRTSELVKIQSDELGRMWIPKKIQEKLAPGTILTVESQEQGAVWVSISTTAKEKQPAQHTEGTPVVDEFEEPQLVKKGRVTVLRGEVPEGFDWDAFLQEGREDCSSRHQSQRRPHPHPQSTPLSPHLPRGSGSHH